MSRQDAVVIGGGLNGLCVAALLAKAGRSVTVLEADAELGGMARREEFAPNYFSAGLFGDTDALRPQVVQALQLERHGLRLHDKPEALACVAGDSTFLLHEIDKSFASEAAAYLKYREFLGRIAPVIRGFFDEPPLRITAIENEPRWPLMKRALRMRRLGRGDMVELLRVAPMAVSDYLGEYFSSSALMAALALPALRGNFAGPQSPGTCAPLLFHECTRSLGAKGGSAALAKALHAAGKEAGVNFVTSDAVSALEIADGRVTSVRTQGGAEFFAPVIVATCHPKHLFLDLVPPSWMTVRTTERIENFRSRGTTAQLLLALDSQIEIKGGCHRARVVDDLTALEKAFDPVKYGEMPAAPALEVWIPSASDQSLCPAGHSVVSVLVHFVPENLREGWNDSTRGRLRAVVMQRLERLIPGVSEQVVGERLRTPADLARDFHLPGGNILHGEPALDQTLVRPIPEAADYRTPFAGLYLAGSGSHAGGGPTLAPAYLAAQAILGD